MAMSPLIAQLVEALRHLPGVGPKSAQRMALHLLERDRDGGRRLATLLAESMDRVGNCRRCRTLTEESMCAICVAPDRDHATLCVVETPADMAAIAATGYRGDFFVLLGHLSPLDGIGPEEIGVDALCARLDEGGLSEVILATGSTVEGQATAHFVGELARDRGLRVTRIAQGVPLGGELEFVDGSTLAHAVSGRRDVE